MPCSTDRWSLAVLTLSVFASALAETRPEAASGGRLTIHLTAPPAPGDCAPAAAGAWLKAVALGDVLAADADIERYRSDDHALEFTTAATTRLFTNAATYDREEVGVVPAGAFFSAAGRGFVVTLDGKRLVGGMVTPLDRMREPTPCVQLYFLPPLTSGGRLQVSIGRPKAIRFACRTLGVTRLASDRLRTAVKGLPNWRTGCCGLATRRPMAFISPSKFRMGLLLKA